MKCLPQPHFSFLLSKYAKLLWTDIFLTQAHGNPKGKKMYFFLENELTVKVYRPQRGKKIHEENPGDKQQKSESEEQGP